MHKLLLSSCKISYILANLCLCITWCMIIPYLVGFLVSYIDKINFGKKYYKLVISVLWIFVICDIFVMPLNYWITKNKLLSKWMHEWMGSECILKEPLCNFQYIKTSFIGFPITYFYSLSLRGIIIYSFLYYITWHFIYLILCNLTSYLFYVM